MSVIYFRKYADDKMYLFSYSMEASGVSCGLSWLKHDFNHASFIMVMTIEYATLFLLAILFLRSAKSYVDSPTVLEVNTKNWFTEKQLVWVSYSILISGILLNSPFSHFIT